MIKILIHQQIEPHLAFEEGLFKGTAMEKKLLLLLQQHFANQLQQSKTTQIVPPNPTEMRKKHVNNKPEDYDNDDDATNTHTNSVINQLDQIGRSLTE